MKVTKEVFTGLEAVRLSGATNMLAYPTVMKIAQMMGFEETHNWLTAHKKEYCEGVFEGFEVEGEDE